MKPLPYPGNNNYDQASQLWAKIYQLESENAALRQQIYNLQAQSQYNNPYMSASQLAQQKQQYASQVAKYAAISNNFPQRSIGDFEDLIKKMAAEEEKEKIPKELTELLGKLV